MGETDRVTIAEARARRTDPVWRRRHYLADLRGLGLVGVLLVAPPVAVVLWPPVGAIAIAVVLVGGAAGLAAQGPVVGLERRSAVLVAVPVLNLVILVPAVWRCAHLGLQRWQGPLQPPLSEGGWLAAAVVGVACWMGAAGLLVTAIR